MPRYYKEFLLSFLIKEDDIKSTEVTEDGITGSALPYLRSTASQLGLQPRVRGQPVTLSRLHVSQQSSELIRTSTHIRTYM